MTSHTVLVSTLYQWMPTDAIKTPIKLCCCCKPAATDYGHPERAFFRKSQTLLGAFEVFSADLSAPILILWVPCPCFPLINHYFYKKLSLYIHIPNIYLGLRFEFGPQRIRDLAIVCPLSLSNTIGRNCIDHYLTQIINLL